MPIKLLLKGPFVFSLAATLAFAFGDKDKKDNSRFVPGPASSYSHQTTGKVTVAAVPYVTEEQARTAFGKQNPYEYGILPVLVIVQNDSDQALRLDRMQAQYESPSGKHLDPVAARDIPGLLKAPKRPEIYSPVPRIPGYKPKHKGPLSGWEIEGREFAAKLIPAHDSAYGFFYFQTGFMESSQLYLSGIVQAGTGKELFYYEVPLHQP